ncbi:anaerobic ribonucleoside-triphosphate reductase activating protein [Actinotalea sp.]|uniref:anaerobic ribonucleoside-triphosphate reductase activating protein n=1 Tax=Actinotalea sp. TaxID=1872145 RepID=UPI003567FF2A
MRSPARAEALQIAGLVPLSTCDWPGRIVATAFLQGCPWSCTYCHNPGLLDSRTPGTVPWSAVTDLLARRTGLLDGVVFSGGEPTRQAALLPAVRTVRELGFGVGLHTAGAYPRLLRAVLPWVDWVGLDLKASAPRYPAITGVAGSGAAAWACLDAVLEAGVAVQVRTTVDPTVHGTAEVEELQQELAGRGVTDHVLQTVRTVGVRPEYATRLAQHAILSASG